MLGPQIITNMIKIYHVSNCRGYSNWMGDVTPVTKMSQADLVLLPGGADVQAVYYGEKQGKWLNSDPHSDRIEAEAFKNAVKLGIPIWGTCKGLKSI